MNFLDRSYFPDGQSASNKKLLSESELVALLSGNESLFPPVRLDVDVHFVHPSHIRSSGLLKVSWKNEVAEYVIEYKASASPRALQDALSRLLSIPFPPSRLPLVIVPYLSDEALRILDIQEISGLDLCGNGLLISEHFRILRTGYPNLYKDTRPIRNPYVGDSSVFVRAFLLQSQFTSLTDLRNFVISRMLNDPRYIITPPRASHFTLGTASKVVRTLEDELVVRKEGDQIILQDASRLTSLLRRGQRKTDRSTLIGKTILSNEQIWSKLLDIRQNNGIRSVATGLASATHYGVLSGIDKLSIYVESLASASEELEIRPGRAFANIELVEESKNVVYFDSRPDGNIRWASPIQTWLELASAGGREQEAASQLEQLLKEGHAAEL